MSRDAPSPEVPPAAPAVVDDTATARTWAVPDQPEGVTTVWDRDGERWDYDANTDQWYWEDSDQVPADPDDDGGWRWDVLLKAWGPLTDRAPVTGAGDG